MKNLKFMDDLSSKEKFNNIYKYLLNDGLIEEVIYSERPEFRMDKLQYEYLIKNVKKKIRLKKVNNPTVNKITEKVILYLLYSIFENKLNNSFSRFKPLDDDDLFTSRVSQCVINNSKFKRKTKYFRFEISQIDISIDDLLDMMRNSFNIKDSMFLFTLKILMSENLMNELLGYLKNIYIFQYVDQPIFSKSINHPMNDNIRKNSNKRYKQWGYEKYREKFEDCFLMNLLRKDNLGFVFFTIDEDRLYIRKILEDIKLIENIEYLEVDENNYIITDRHKIRHTERSIAITRLTVNDDFNKIRNCVKCSFRNIKSYSKRYAGLQEISKFVYDNKISTNITHHLVKLNQLIYKLGYKKLKVLDRKNNKNHFFYKGDKYYNFDIFEMRKMSNLSYSRIIKENKIWSIENNRKNLWLRFNDRTDTGFKGVYFRLLSTYQVKDPIFNIPFSNFENDIDIHHIRGNNKDNTCDNLTLISRKAHVIVEGNKELSEYDSDKYLTKYVNSKKLKYFRNKKLNH